MHKNMQNKLSILEEAEREAAEMQRYLDRITGLIRAAYRTGDLKIIGLTHEILKEERREMNRHSNLMNAKLEMLKEGNMKRSERLIVGTVILLLMAMLLISVVGAQDTSVETTASIIDGAATLVDSTVVAATEAPGELPAATEQPPVVVVNNPPAAEPTDRTFYVIGFIGLLLLFGVRDAINSRQIGALLTTINRALDNRQVIDEARQRYSEASLSVQEFIKLLRGVTGFVGSMNIPGIDPTIDKTNEFLGDVTSPEPPGPEIPNVRDPDPFMPQYPVDGKPNAFG